MDDAGEGFRGRMRGGPKRAMTPQEFAAVYPKMLDWIHETLASYRRTARTVASLQFARLPLYFSDVVLQGTYYVPINRVPIPPLSAMGLERFAAFEQGDYEGITYLNTYFLKHRHVSGEALHFHELIHVVQWPSLGPERFLKTYAEGLDGVTGLAGASGSLVMAGPARSLLGMLGGRPSV